MEMPTASERHFKMDSLKHRLSNDFHISMTGVCFVSVEVKLGVFFAPTAKCGRNAWKYEEVSPSDLAPRPIFTSQHQPRVIIPTLLIFVQVLVHIHLPSPYILILIKTISNDNTTQRPESIQF